MSRLVFKTHPSGIRTTALSALAEVLVGLLLVTGVGSLPTVASATEVATGVMLGPRFKPDRFYMRMGGRWEETYSHRVFRTKARGRLMILWLPNALFEDEWLIERDFDPDENTDRVIASLDVYNAHGVGAIGVSLQGGVSGYSVEVNGINRNGIANAGKESGSLVSAFEPDGSLKESWLGRLERLLLETDRRGMVVCLAYFGRGQDEIFESPRAIVTAARNMTDWLIEKDFRNVVIDVAPGWDLEAQNWDHGSFIPEYIAHVLEDVRERFHDAAFALPIGASSGGNMAYPDSLAQLCDVILVQGNGVSPDQKRVRLRELRSNLRPVWMIEDDNGAEPTLATLSRETASANALFANGAGWGFRPLARAHLFPFDYRPGSTSELTDEVSPTERDRAYFKAVLEHIATLVLKKPPHKQQKKR